MTPPDLFKYRLINSRLINSTFLHNKEGCLLSDVSDENNAYMVYFVSFLGTLAVLPGNIVSALLMDKIGRLRMLGRTQPLWDGEKYLAFSQFYVFVCSKSLSQGDNMVVFFVTLFVCSRLQRHLLHQLFLPVFWQQRVRHDRSTLPVRWHQHRLLERSGRAHRGALPV